MMNEQTVCIAYCGESVDNGIMDVNQLAPALLAFGDLIHECNHILNKDSSKVSVYVKSNFQKGSFEINLQTVQKLADRLSYLITPQTFSLKEILDLLGFTTSITGVNLLTLIQWIRGRKIEKAETIDKDTVRLTIDKETREYSVAGWQLFKSRKVRESIEGMLSPLNNDGIESFEVRDKTNNTAFQHIDKSESEYFSVPADNTEEQTFESIRMCVVKVSSVNFEKDLKWRFATDTVKFYAEILDEEFLKKVEQGDIAFTKGVSLKVDLKEIQRLGKDATTKTEYFITKVHDIIGRPEQLTLPI